MKAKLEEESRQLTEVDTTSEHYFLREEYLEKVELEVPDDASGTTTKVFWKNKIEHASQDLDSNTAPTPTQGLRYKKSKSSEDKDDDEILWPGESVEGTNGGDGWVKVDRRT